MNIEGGQKAPTDLSFVELREETLLVIKSISDELISADDEDLEGYALISGTGDNTQTIPFWYQMNGPIEDAVWHIGQIVTLRRMAGNPISNEISLFRAAYR